MRRLLDNVDNVQPRILWLHIQPKAYLNVKSAELFYHILEISRTYRYSVEIANPHAAEVRDGGRQCLALMEVCRRPVSKALALHIQCIHGDRTVYRRVKTDLLNELRKRNVIT